MVKKLQHQQVNGMSKFLNCWVWLYGQIFFLEKSVGLPLVSKFRLSPLYETKYSYITLETLGHYL